ncbi:flagellar biosynthesis protein FlhF [Deferribacter autotrophicus]|uniref:Flagellar biosynthesis protein FlhF n=1 Tax=Deferribacter autotrophicus TaxID=500465 RepID=A0A5A8F5I6_9BACT|nr:flagellar biosynthesis protein FlhF [Deferribacter autotrophicus]KAA0257117.1 flagellar biosynthesis protein FlhF [Deferribacter autotrophicus]
MKIKKYEVYDMREAIELIKKDLGPDAVILSTKKIVKNGSFGLFSRPIIEVTAAIDYEPEVKSKKEKLTDNTVESKKTDIDIEELINRLGLDKFEVVLKEISEIKRQLAEMKNQSKTEFSGIDLPERLGSFYSVMVKNGVDDIIAYKFLKKIEKRISADFSKAQIKKIVVQLLGDLIPVEKDYFTSLKQKIVAMVGPTGVGKTTTIAKIAANLSLKFQKKVALITIDTFRIGAVEQLRTYAEIVNIPLKVASTPEELKSHIAELKDFEYIFVDSMGRSQYDDAQIKELATFLDASPLITTVLVLSMSSNHAEMYDTFDRYKMLHPEYLIFTKLDETRHFGPLINVPIIKKVPLLLLSTGQNVPEDLEIPDGRKIAIKLLNEIQRMWRE